MGKSLKELLDTFPFENGLNPRNSGPGTINPEPSDRFTNDIEDAKQWLKATPNLYGTDLVRIMTQTDPHKTKKAVKKAADRVGGAIGGRVGAVVGGVASKIAEFYPKFPDDWTKGEDGNPTGMQNNFYAGTINGDYARGFYYNAYHKNSKSKLGQFLQANKSPEQVKNAIVPALKSAAIGLAVGLVAAGVSALFKNKNKKKGKEGPAIPTKKEKYNNAFFIKDKFNKLYFPSTLLINEGFNETGYGLSFRNYSRLSQRNGNIGTLNYLEKDGATIIKDMAPILDVTQFTDIDKTKGISDYYSQALYNNTPQTRNEGNVIVSAKMIQNNYLPANALQFIGPFGGTYTADRDLFKEERSLDNKVQNYSRFVDAEGNAFVAFGNRSIRGGYTNNDISKLASLTQRYGASTTNLLTITAAKEGDTPKIHSLGDPLDPNGNFYTWAPTDTSYTKDFIVSKDNTTFIAGDSYANEVKLNTEQEFSYSTNGGLSQKFGASDTDLLQKIDDTDKMNYKFPYKTIGGLETVARWNTKEEPFSKNVSDIRTNRISFLNLANQTQTNVSEVINPYLTKKKNVLEKNETDIIKVSIGGIRFLATLTNLSDKNTSNWDGVKPIGSGINFYLFNNWERNISFDLILYAENRNQLDLIWEKVNDVTKFTTGNPSGRKGAAYGVYGNIVRLQLGDLINENGFVSDITMNVDTISPWEIDNGQQLPFVCTISVGFQVVTNLEGNEYEFYRKK